MSLNLVAALLNIANEDVTPAIDTSNIDNDIVDTLELVTAPSEVFKTSEDMDTLLSAVVALTALQKNPMNTVDNSSEFIELSKMALSTTIAMPITDISLESVTVQLKHIVNQIKEMIKRFFLAIARSFGFWRTRVVAIMKELERSESKVKQYMNINGRVQVSSTLSSLDMKWHQINDPVTDKITISITPGKDILKQTGRWVHQREVAINTCKSVAKNLGNVETTEETNAEMERLSFSVSASGTERLFIPLLGGHVIQTDPRRTVFEFSDYTVNELTERTHQIDTGALLEILDELKEAGSELLKIELSAERDNVQLENAYLHLTNRAEFYKATALTHTVGILKDASFRIFRCDAGVIDSFIHVASIYIRKAKVIK